MLWIAIERLHVNLNDVHELPDLKEHNLVALSDALSGLATFDARMSQVVELRFFGGLTVDETADVLNVSPETVNRDWKTANAWLLLRDQARPPHRIKIRSHSAQFVRFRWWQLLSWHNLPEELRRWHPSADPFEFFDGHAIKSVLAAGLLDGFDDHPPDERRDLLHSCGCSIVPCDRRRRFAGVLDQWRRPSEAPKG